MIKFISIKILINQQNNVINFNNNNQMNDNISHIIIQNNPNKSKRLKNIKISRLLIIKIKIKIKYPPKKY